VAMVNATMPSTDARRVGCIATSYRAWQTSLRMRRGPMAPAVEADLSGHEPARREVPGGRVSRRGESALLYDMTRLR
jgi:hypothetical protein